MLSFSKLSKLKQNYIKQFFIYARIENTPKKYIAKILKTNFLSVENFFYTFV